MFNSQFFLSRTIKNISAFDYFASLLQKLINFTLDCTKKSPGTLKLAEKALQVYATQQKQIGN